MNLPKGYRFAYKAEIEPHEVLSLRQSVGWGPGDTDEGWLNNTSNCMEAVGVKDENSLLIGIGFIVGNQRHAVLCDFNVHPEYQGKGFGTAILERRLEIIDEQRIPYIYTSLASTNPLIEKYKSYGLVSNGNAYFKDNSSA